MEWTIAITNAPTVASLFESFEQGPIIDDQGRRRLDEALVDMAGGLKIEVFANEHPPPHFRVSFQGQSANYRIADCVKLNGGLDRFYRNVRDWHRVHKQVLIAEWNRRRPTNCPVGNYIEP